MQKALESNTIIKKEIFNKIKQQLSNINLS